MVKPALQRRFFLLGSQLTQHCKRKKTGLRTLPWNKACETGVMLLLQLMHPRMRGDVR